VPSPRPGEDHSPVHPTTVSRGCYLRVSVTDRCDNRCRYCMPPDGAMLAPAERILRYEEFVRAAQLIHRVRPLRKIRITGGEPLIRRNIASFVGQLRRHFPETELTMTTNGTTLAEMADTLHRAGLSRINVSLDALDPKRFHRSSGMPGPEQVIRGIDAALTAGLAPVKLNTVLQRSINLDQLDRLVSFAAERGCEHRFIELMRIGPAQQLDDDEYVSMAEALERLGSRWPGARPLEGGENSRRFQIETDRGPVKIGFITPVSHPFCDTCDRLRLDSRGRLHACLRHGERIDLRSMIRGQADEEWTLRRIRQLLQGKGSPGTEWDDDTRMFSMGG